MPRSQTAARIAPPPSRSAWDAATTELGRPARPPRTAARTAPVSAATQRRRRERHFARRRRALIIDAALALLMTIILLSVTAGLGVLALLLVPVVGVLAGSAIVRRRRSRGHPRRSRRH